MPFERLQLACPVCHTPLIPAGLERMMCPLDGHIYKCLEGVWRCLTPERRAYFARFVEEYDTIRRAEGRGVSDPAYYRALPYRDLTGRMSADWKIRAASFRALLRRAVRPLERQHSGGLRVLDLGAGNGWLAYQLTRRGHQAGAVDLRLDVWDGLGALRHYDAPVLGVQAEFDHLPFARGQFELVVFNAALHYAEDYRLALNEALRTLAPGGVLAILDTPVYQSAASGQAMVREREANFIQKYGFPSNAIPSENYLTWERLSSLGEELGVQWATKLPFAGVRFALRHWRARFNGHREPARFPLILARQEEG